MQGYRTEDKGDCKVPRTSFTGSPVSEKTTLLGSSVNRGNTPLTLFNLTFERHTWFRIYGRRDRAI
jgi:hypothetical protein